MIYTGTKKQKTLELAIKKFQSAMRVHKIICQKISAAKKIVLIILACFCLNLKVNSQASHSLT